LPILPLTVIFFALPHRITTSSSSLDSNASGFPHPMIMLWDKNKNKNKKVLDFY